MFDQLVQSQLTTGGVIEAIIRNFKKDSTARKTCEYYEERLKRLETAWSEFEATDNELRDLKPIPLDHEYFSKNYYQNISELVEKYGEIFKAAILELSTKIAGEASQASDKPPSTLNSSGATSHTPIASAIRRQNVMMQSLSRLLTVESTTNDIKIKEKLWEQIQELHFSIWENCQNPLQEGYDMTAYTTLESKFIENLNMTSFSVPEPGVSNDQINVLPLPKITIPKFNGDYLKWKSFSDLFVQLVHNQQIPAVQKMWYLKTNITGEAERLIGHLLATTDNYETAWNMLNERYDNKRVLVSSIIQQLLDQPSVSSSAASIKQLHDTTHECLHALQNLEIDTTTWDPLLMHLLVKKLDRNVHNQYERSITKPKELQRIEHFLAFLETRFQSMEIMGQKERPSPKTYSSAASNISESKCKLCKTGSHQLYRCEHFQKLSPSNRLNFVQKQKLCVNCLKAGHASKQCMLKGCPKCNKRHNSLLHLEIKVQPSITKSSNEEATVPPSAPLCSAASSTTANKQPSSSLVLLGTAIIKIKTESSEIECRALLDSGSQVNCITERLVKRLHIPLQPSSANINGIGRTNTKIQHRVNVILQSRLNGFSTQLEAFVLPHIISPQPSQFINKKDWPLPKNIVLADPNFNRPDRIDVLLGAEHFLQLLSIGQIKLSTQLPILQNTMLGWVISGKIQNNNSSILTCAVLTNDDLQASISRLWSLDEIKTVEKPLSLAEKKCEEFFAQTTTRNNEQRFVVRIPFHQGPESLGESYKIALNRFLALEHRLQKNTELKIQYTKFMDEYETMNHMTKISSNSICSPHYFIPHHCVLKPNSSTTKLRVVFDASAKTTSGYSLNDLMHIGPTIQSELFSILLRFRLPRYVFSSDVEKMYRQVLISPEDRNFQLIIWRKDPSEPLTYYQLNTVTYGTRSAPYLATKCLQQLAKQNATRYPLASQFLKGNFYVDDGLGGCDSLNTAIQLQEQLQKIMKSGGFYLRKWCANHPQLLKNVPQCDVELNLDFDSSYSESTSTLGLTWLPKEDQLCIKVNVVNSKRITKRIVTSDLARIFDPLGLLSPIAVSAKIFIQELWKLNLDWDQALPEAMHTKWMTFRTELNKLKTLQIPRHIANGGVPKALQLHMFSDASEKAYGAAAYLRSIMPDGTVLTRLLCAKSRVAPLKTQSIPRLELCAAMLGAQLATKIVIDLKLTNQVWCWTDSEIVLSWINSPTSLNTFVANRIGIILENTKAEQWRHIGTKCNPADILSRGIAPGHLKDCSLWFYGPLFLHGNEATWPPTFNPNRYIQTTQERRMKHSLAITSTEPDFIYKINHKNSFWHLQRIVGYILRFINNIKCNKDSRQYQKSLTTIELNDALILITKQMQASDFKEEIQHLTKYKKVPGTSNLRNLTPFLDTNGLIRVGGRLDASPFEYDSKHQLLIPYNDPISKLIFDMLHKDNKHCGAQTLLGLVRQRFWPIKGKIMARAAIHRCVTCSRAKPALFHQIMGNLPSTRVTPARPFINAGVDYCGPITVHYKIRGKRPHKAYIAVFCCFATKAVHLEIVSDLTTDAFIGAIKRFISRRGHCQYLYCDNATNFVGAKNKLVELSSAIYTEESREKIENACSKKGIQFKFIPPRAPHFGGLWEAAVKSAKHLLIRSLANASLTYEELETLIIEIEAILNSRPISPMSDDPNDISALTPGHFLIGEPLTAQVDAEAKSINPSLATRWKLVSHLKHSFWGRWSRDYLNELQYRNKWKEQSKCLKPGTIVILKEDNSPVMKWPIGRVIQTYKGDDDIVRVADVKTASGILKRAVHYLAPLPRAEIDKEDNRSEDEFSEPKSKRTKVVDNNTTLTILTLLSILPIILGVPISNEQFGSKLGIHFERLGSSYISTSQWNLVVYYDLSAYWTDMVYLVNGTNSLSRLCDKIENNSVCFDTIEHLRHIESDLQLDNRLLYKSRSKRGAVDFVGNIANSLFGILDSEYAKQLSQTITKLQENDSYLLNLAKEHTSVINSTMNIVKKGLSVSKSKFDHLLSKINEITKSEETLSQELHLLKVSQTLSMGILQLSLMANKLQRMQACILNTLTDTHHGRINPLLLTPTQLETEIQKIKTHIPQSLELPMPEDDLLEFYKLTTIKGGITRDHVVFTITLPLIDHEKFELYNLISIPTLINGTMLTIDVCSPTLAINTTLGHYHPVSSAQLTDCDVIDQNTFICYDVQAEYNFGAELCLCEISLFNNVSTPTCALKNISTNITWTPLTERNKWIYSSLVPTQATAACGREIIPINLIGSGLLTINPDCILKHELIYMSGQQSLSTRTTSSYTSLGNFSDLSRQHLTKIVDINHNNGSFVRDDIAAQLSELTNLQQKLKSMTSLEFQPHTSSNHGLNIAYVALFISFVSIICFLIRAVQRRIVKRCKKSGISEPPNNNAQSPSESQLSANNDPGPSPAPRQTFTIQI